MYMSCPVYVLKKYLSLSLYLSLYLPSGEKRSPPTGCPRPGTFPYPIRQVGCIGLGMGYHHVTVSLTGSVRTEVLLDLLPWC
jgi:hypothetical protein